MVPACQNQAMGMRAHLVAINANEGILSGSVTDDRLYELLTGSEATEIDKSWEAVFPLVGSIAGTGMMLVDDAVPVGGDLVYGPAMFIEPERVAGVNSFLASADSAAVEDHWQRLDSPFMSNGSYDDEQGKEFAMDCYRKTTELFADAAAASNGILFAIL